MSETPPQRSALGTALRSYLDARAAALLTARKTLGINELDARALLHVLAHPGIRPSELRTVFGLTSAGVTVLTDRLVERGVLRRDPDADDRRSVRLVATVDIGTAPWNALTSFDDAFEAAVRELDDDSANVCADLITRLMRAVGA